jgi:hypothetical protein
MIEKYGIEGAEREEFDELARSSRAQSWTSNFSKHFSQQSLTLFALESTAKRVLTYEPTYIPGLLQTTEYSRALLHKIGVTDEERLESIMNARAERQDVFRRENRPLFHFIITEAPVSRPAGSNGVMRRQLHRLIELSQEGKVTIQLIPFSAGLHPKVDESFTLLEFEDEKVNDVVYLENAGRETVSREDPAEFADYLIAFERICELAYPSEELPARLEELIAARFSAEETPNGRGD